MSLEREQLALLGQHLLVIIDELERRGLLAIDAGLPVPDEAPPTGRPPREDFRAGTLTLAWDEDGDRVIIEAVLDGGRCGDRRARIASRRWQTRATWSPTMTRSARTSCACA